MFEEYVSVSDIARTTNRLPYTIDEFRFLKSFLVESERKARDLRIDDPFQDTGDLEPSERLKRQIEDGVICLTSKDTVSRSFLFVKESAGRGFFGGQKAIYRMFIGSAEDDKWLPAGSKKMWAMAVTSIGNVFREMGER